jgi:hypothetical protein
MLCLISENRRETKVHSRTTDEWAGGRINELFFDFGWLHGAWDGLVFEGCDDETKSVL